MKRALLLLLLCVIPVMAQAAPVTGTLSFTYDLVKIPPCSATVTTNCLSGFQVAEGDASNQNAVNTVLLPVPTPAATQPTLVSASYTTKFSGLGAFSIIVTPIFKDGSGNVLNGPVAALAVANNGVAVGNLKFQ